MLAPVGGQPAGTGELLVTTTWLHRAGGEQGERPGELIDVCLVVRFVDEAGEAQIDLRTLRIGPDSSLSTS
ncbi:hypothetical protein OG288_12105 [Streptomyces tauricus]|uniref:Uncharacterized protein n=1 Tax=Streptomyces tauricus TaxID=68274 RepID=A0ABZ1JFF3_9ACTN|nr:hypothetical protein [Streptomyces tauricus]